MPRKLSEKAFTLIELLVVIAIIAILSAILFPVFAGAREKARQAACQSNLKQIATAILMYAQDYDGYGPGQASASPSYYHSCWQGQIASYLGYTGDLSNCWGAGGTATHADRYIKILRCPSRWNTTKFWSGGAAYGMNAHLTLANSSDPQVNIYDLKYLAKTFMAGDIVNYNCIWPQWIANALDPNYSYFPGMHNGGLNIAFCDGHVEFVMGSSVGADWEYAKSDIIFREGWRSAPK